MRLEEGEEEAQSNNSILKTDDLDAMADMESDQESEVEQFLAWRFWVEHLVLGSQCNTSSE